MAYRITPLILLLLSVGAGAQDFRDYTVEETQRLQRPSEVMQYFPKRVDGKPDWVRLLQRGLIMPRSTISGAPRDPEALGDAPEKGILFSNTQFMPYVMFPHQPHIEWLACVNCHDGLFERKATGKGMGMTAIFEGQHCGTCHGRVAFSPEGSCYRCHSVPNEAALNADSPFAVPPPQAQNRQVETVEEENPVQQGRRGKARRSSGIFPSRVVAPTMKPDQ